MRVTVHIPTLLAYNALIVASVYFLGRKRGERRKLKQIAWAQYRSPADVQTDYLRRKREEEVLG